MARAGGPTRGEASQGPRQVAVLGERREIARRDQRHAGAEPQLREQGGGAEQWSAPAAQGARRHVGERLLAQRNVGEGAERGELEESIEQRRARDAADHRERHRPPGIAHLARRHCGVLESRHHEDGQECRLDRVAGNQRQVRVRSESQPCAGHQQQRGDLHDGERGGSAPAGLDAHPVDESEQRDQRDRDGDPAHGRRGHESAQRRGEADAHRRQPEDPGGHAQPAHREPDVLSERVAGVHIGPAAAVVQGRELGEAERDQHAQRAAPQDAGHAAAAAYPGQRRDQEIDAAADDPVDADADGVQQRKLALQSGMFPCLRCGTSWRLFRSICSARQSCGRVSSGRITSST